MKTQKQEDEAGLTISHTSKGAAAGVGGTEVEDLDRQDTMAKN